MSIRETMAFSAEVGGLAEQRSQCYGLLSLSFYMPTPELVKILNDGETLSSLFEEKGLLPISCPGLKELISVVEACNDGELLQELSQSYVKLFFASPHFPAPPYESVYLPEGLVMGEPALQVKRLYQSEGLDLAQTFKDLPDHIAAELEFMAFLSKREAAAWQEGSLQDVAKQVSKEEAFLRGHLCRWLPDFSRRLIEAKEPFYAPLAQVVDNFIRLDCLRLSALLQALSQDGEGLQ